MIYIKSIIINYCFVSIGCLYFIVYLINNNDTLFRKNRVFTKYDKVIFYIEYYK